MVILEQHIYQTIVLPIKLATGNIHDYPFCYCPLVSILFEVLTIIWPNYHNSIMIWTIVVAQSGCFSQ